MHVTKNSGTWQAPGFEQFVCDSSGLSCVMPCQPQQHACVDASCSPHPNPIQAFPVDDALPQDDDDDDGDDDDDDDDDDDSIDPKEITP